jgi:drug/metabolite transporter (DMT)-like permease
LKLRWLAVFTLLAIAAAWGATFTLVKHILGKIAPEPFIFYRFTLAGVILLIAAAARGRLNRTLVRPGVVLGILVFAGYWLQTRGLIVISPSRSALLTGLYVVMVPFAERVVWRTTVPLRAWLASVLAVAGTAILIGGFDARPTFGDVLTIACAVAFTIHVVLSARYTHSHSATGLAAVQVLVVGIAAAPASLFAPRAPLTQDVVLVIIFTAIVTTALAFAAMMWGQAHVTATEAAVILSFEPVAAAITSIVWDKEPVTASFLIGGATILVAMIASQLRGRSSATMRTDGANPRHQ